MVWLFLKGFSEAQLFIYRVLTAANDDSTFKVEKDVPTALEYLSAAATGLPLGMVRIFKYIYMYMYIFKYPKFFFLLLVFLPFLSLVAPFSYLATSSFMWYQTSTSLFT